MNSQRFLKFIIIGFGILTLFIPFIRLSSNIFSFSGNIAFLGAYAFFFTFHFILPTAYTILCIILIWKRIRFLEINPVWMIPLAIHIIGLLSYFNRIANIFGNKNILSVTSVHFQFVLFVIIVAFLTFVKKSNLEIRDKTINIISIILIVNTVYYSFISIAYISSSVRIFSPLLNVSIFNYDGVFYKTASYIANFVHFGLPYNLVSILVIGIFSLTLGGILLKPNFHKV